MRISQPFYLGTFEVTNAQYERFDPSHRRYRGRFGYSTENNDAMTCVSWYDAVRFCEWLSTREGLPYRLPTEAEWEYTCRAGTTTAFSTGTHLPPAFRKEPLGPPPAPGFEQVSLEVGMTPSNAWALFDMHGNLEEWCSDSYGPYVIGYENGPIGPGVGNFKVTRGGSHSTAAYYLRSSNRLGSLPDDRDWTIGMGLALRDWRRELCGRTHHRRWSAAPNDQPPSDPLAQSSWWRLFEDRLRSRIHGRTTHSGDEKLTQ